MAMEISKAIFFLQTQIKMAMEISNANFCKHKMAMEISKAIFFLQTQNDHRGRGWGRGTGRVENDHGHFGSISVLSAE